MFFDVRNDSDALFSLYGISLAGVQDLQLMELATKRQGRSTKYVCGLAKCIERDVQMTAEQKRKWLDVKEKVRQAFSSETGGIQDIFIQRPITEQIRMYCSQDVAYLPDLWKTYASEVCKPNDSGFWRYMIRKTSKARVELSQSKNYNDEARNKVLSPWYAELIQEETDDWNEDVMDLGYNEQATLKELSFGEFVWTW